ncbi:hypothetical protein DCAR_0415774 [Daucus carota subsp. sativus]|uniref:Uncharacterized protein n=1 Tax=Daucus carota subsp. sativus TaxID=79200 RepID=A0AAF0WV94_DAUCS|nr:hypothetical protein DCAR_0415774 [Daucus carota subsp. sativus]
MCILFLVIKPQLGPCILHDSLTALRNHLFNDIMFLFPDIFILLRHANHLS